MAMKPEILYFKNLKYAYWRLEAVVEVVDRREGDDLDEVALESSFFSSNGARRCESMKLSVLQNTVATW